MTFFFCFFFRWGWWWLMSLKQYNINIGAKRCGPEVFKVYRNGFYFSSIGHQWFDDSQNIRCIARWSGGSLRDKLHMAYEVRFASTKPASVIEYTWVHPGRLTAGTYKSPIEKGKWCSKPPWLCIILIFRGVKMAEWKIIIFRLLVRKDRTLLQFGVVENRNHPWFDIYLCRDDLSVYSFTFLTWFEYVLRWNCWTQEYFIASTDTKSSSSIILWNCFHKTYVYTYMYSSSFHKTCNDLYRVPLAPLLPPVFLLTFLRRARRRLQ